MTRCAYFLTPVEFSQLTLLFLIHLRQHPSHCPIPESGLERWVTKSVVMFSHDSPYQLDKCSKGWSRELLSSKPTWCTKHLVVRKVAWPHLSSKIQAPCSDVASHSSSLEPITDHIGPRPGSVKPVVCLICKFLLLGLHPFHLASNL